MRRRHRRRRRRRCHVGYYLVDRGVPALRARLGYRPTLRQSIVDRVCAQPTASTSARSAITTAAIVLTLVYAIGYSAHALSLRASC